MPVHRAKSANNIMASAMGTTLLGEGILIEKLEEDYKSDADGSDDELEHVVEEEEENYFGVPDTLLAAGEGPATKADRSNNEVDEEDVDVKKCPPEFNLSTDGGTSKSPNARQNSTILSNS